MATVLKHKALANINKGNTSAYYSYVEEKNGTNPVLQQLEKELSDYMGFVKKKQDGLLKAGEHAPCKVSDALFDIWNKFEPRIPKRYFYQKLMQIGEFLVQYKEYSAAAWQCYDRYLNQFIKDINFSMIKDVKDLKEKIFPDSESNDENNDVTFRALMGHCICLYHFTLTTDPKLQNVNSIQQLCEVLRIIRLIMQFQLEVEEYCWLVYNGTIYLYTICRYMMQYGLGKQVLEYLIWSCLCMETSIPLLGVKYLTWRATLYVATCQCFYDCKYFEDGEAFARRALSKINELHELELASINGNKGAEAPQFRDATIKIGTMLFKRIVFESRRKSKNILRPKTRLVYKDLHTLAFPRTTTEKLLAEMFDCASSRFLAIEEALNDSNRRIAMPTPAGTEVDVEILDVTLELFFAAEYLANGGGGKQKPSVEILSEFKAIVPDNKSLIQMAIDNEDSIPLKNLIRVIQLAFSYEAWDIFRRLSIKILAFFQTSSEVASRFTSEIQVLNLLQTVDKYLAHQRKLKFSKSDNHKELKSNNHSRQSPKTNNSKSPERNKEPASKDTTESDRKKLEDIAETFTAISDEDAQSLKGAFTQKSGKSVKSKKSRSKSKVLSEIAENGDNEETDADGSSPRSSLESVREEDLLANIANKIMQIINLNTKFEKLDLDIMIDVTLMLWKKCKEVFQKYQNGAQDNYRWITKLENLSRWLYILNIVHESMSYFNISSIDPAVFANCALRLSLIYESLANIGSRKSAMNLQLNEDDRAITVRILDMKSAADIFSSFGEKLATSDVKGNLIKAKKILKKSLQSIATARASISKSDKSCLCNKNYDETNNEEDCSASLEQLKALKESIFQYKKNQQGDSVWNMIGDLHVELIFLYNKISVRLLEYGEALSLDMNANFEKNFEQLLKECKKNKISQSLLYLSKALYYNSSPSLSGKYSKEKKELIEKAYKCLLKAEEEDKRLFYKHVKIDATIPTQSKVPLAPVVYLTTHNKIILSPRLFQPSNGATVSWYRIFASPVTGPNSKARISDYNFPGTGDQIPSNSSDQIVIQGLTPDEKYIFAVAAYDNNGKLIGDSIGDSTDPILASSTLSLLMNWAYLCQASYQTENYSVSKIAFDVLWQYFIYKPAEKQRDTIIKQNEVNYQLTFHQLNYNVVRKTSPILLRKFIESIFISVDIQIKESKIYPDVLFDGRIPYPRQIERLRECEKMLVAIDLAGWLNDPLIILQAVVQCYGLVAPLIYYYIPYEPIIQILTHCLLVLEEIPSSVFQRKTKPIFESLQHMNACTTFYLTEILKKMNKKTLANVFNLIGRKLLSIEENSSLAGADEENEFITVDHPESKPKAIPTSLVTQVRNLTQKTNKNSKNSSQTQIEEKSSGNQRNEEWKALELYLARSTKQQNMIYAILNGSEDTAFIYGFIQQTPTKFAYKELTKFRRRTTYMELLVFFLHKATMEELNHDIRDWCNDTQEWLIRRNVAILGNRAIVVKKPGGVVTVAGNQQLNASLGDFGDESGDKKAVKTSKDSLGNFTSFKKRRIKKYKLLIPLEIEGPEKVKMEDKQKAAIDKIYDLFPEMHEQWTRRKRLRRLLQEEASFKVQFYNIWGLNEFSFLMSRLHQSSPQNELILFTRVYNTEFIDPQNFLFDTNNCLLVSEENRYNKELFKLDEGEIAELLPVPPPTKNKGGAAAAQQAGKKQTLNTTKAAAKSRIVSKTTSKGSKTNKNLRSSTINEKVVDIRDTAELIADAFYGLDVPDENDEAKSTVTGLTSTNNNNKTSKNSTNPPSRFTNFTNLSNFVPALTFNEIVESLKKIFTKFNQAVVIAHRYKEWTLLQNTCKTLWNCMNALFIWLPAAASDSIEIKLNDIWTIVGTQLYTAADNLLDMLFYTSPLEKLNTPMRRVNKWFDSISVSKGGADLKCDIPLDDPSSIDLRFVKKFVYRTIQCLFVNRKWEKLASLIFKFNALTSFSFAEQLSPILIFAQHQLRKQIGIESNVVIGDKKNATDLYISKQPHFERLKAELGRIPQAEDLLFIQFKVQIDPTKIKPLNLGVKIDPRVHDIYDGGERAKELVTVPLDINQSKQNLKDALGDTLYTSRILIHARRLFSIYLLSKSRQTDFFGIHSDLINNNNIRKQTETNDTKRSYAHVEFDNQNLEKNKQHKNIKEFLPNPDDLNAGLFNNENDICIKDVSTIDLKIVIESYKKCISLLTSNKEKDLGVQAMHELGNIYYYKKDMKNAYYWWTEALDLLTSCKDFLVKWRKELIDTNKNEINYLEIIEKYGLWGSFMAGLIASKFAQYLLPNDIEIRTDACLLSAAFYKAIYQGSIPYSKHDVNYTKEDSETINTEFLLPGLNLNSDVYRFDIRNIIQSLNYICLELIDAKYCLNIMPALNLYEYFSRNMARDIHHTTIARLLKIDALINLNKYNEAITLIQRVQRAERLPHQIDEKFKTFSQPSTTKYSYVNWNPSKPIYDIDNLKCLETILSLKLPFGAIKLYGPQIVCKFYMIQCKLFIQIASHFSCMPSLKDFNSSELYEYHSNFKCKNDRVPSKYSQAPTTQTQSSTHKKHNSSFNAINLMQLNHEAELDENPDTIKVFTKNNNLSIEFIKGCLLGTAKVLLTKCLKLFNDDFPAIERYCVSTYWQREFKYELYMLLANIADQSQLDYLALQYIINAINELIVPKSDTVEDIYGEISVMSFKYSSISQFLAPKGMLFDSKQSKTSKKGLFEVFDLMSKSHINSRLWLNARKTFVKYMLNQLSDLGKAKGVDENIIRDFADLKYYCDKGFEESVTFQDCESKAYFEFVNAIIDLTQTNDINSCLNKLQSTLKNLKQSFELSLDGEVLFIKAKLLEIDISYSLKVMDTYETIDNNIKENPILAVLNDLTTVQDFILDRLKHYESDTFEIYKDRSISYFDFISYDIKNLSNIFLSYLIHVKVRFGSSLIIKASTSINDESIKLWQDALKIFHYALELNKVITERSLSLEIELKYKYSRCLRELFVRKQCHIKDVVDSYLDVINLCYYSSHELSLLKNCYLELAMSFINIFSPQVSSGTPMMTPTPDTRTKRNAATAKAIEGALICLTFATKVSKSIREKMLLPGHDILKQMESVQTKNSPIFIANDLLAYYVLADRKRIYKNKIEEEVLTLAPEFEPKTPTPTYDEKYDKLAAESDRSITWTHLLNYHTKLQRINSMKNLNQLSSGLNRYKYSEFFTLSFTPVFNNYNQNTGRLCQLNSYLGVNLDIYKKECIAEFPLIDALRVCSRKAYSSSVYLNKEKDYKSLIENIKNYDGNKGILEIVEKLTLEQELELQQQLQNSNIDESNSQNTSIIQPKSISWSYLELWPINYNYRNNDEHPNKHIMETLQVINCILSVNWYKDLGLKDPVYGHLITAILSTKDSSGIGNHQIKVRFLSAEKVYDIHHKLATLAAIADTALESGDKNNTDMRNEFINSLKSCLHEIAELFNKKLDESNQSKEFNHFELKPSNVIELERIFNPMFGGQSNDESLKTFLLNFF